jgi:hypothetical protein
LLISFPFALNKNLIVYLLLLVFLLSACQNKNEQSLNQHRAIVTTLNEYDEEDAEATEDEYPDGTWCADVEYYNPRTGTDNTYTLDVEVEDGELIQINWPNGGWLDESHFSPEDISSGECSFTSDEGYEYTVTLNEKGGCGL